VSLLLGGDSSRAQGPGVTVTALAPGPVATDYWEIAGWGVTGGQSFEKSVPRPAWISPEQAARAGLDGLESGRRAVVPSLPVRTAMLAGRHVPNALKLPAVEWVMRPR
jgi:short-subunit dehydrogenase